jgi:hypothetical protein
MQRATSNAKARPHSGLAWAYRHAQALRGHLVSRSVTVACGKDMLGQDEQSASRHINACFEPVSWDVSDT